MAARACKKILRHHMTDYLLNLKDKYNENRTIFLNKLKETNQN